MREPRYTLTLENMSINDMLSLLWAAQGIPQPAQKGALRKLDRAVHSAMEQYRQWRRANRKCAGGTK